MSNAVTWADVLEAAKMMGMEPFSEDLPLEEALESFLRKVEETPKEEEGELDPLVVRIYMLLTQDNLPVTGHPSQSMRETSAALEAQGGTSPPDELPVPAGKEPPAKEKVTEKKKKPPKEKKEKPPKEKKEKVPKEKKEKVPGFRGTVRNLLLAGDPEGVIIQKIAAIYVEKGKTQEYGIARGKKIFYDIHKELVNAGKIAAKPKKAPEPIPTEEESPQP